MGRARARAQHRVTARVHACAGACTRACSTGGQKKVGNYISIYNIYYSHDTQFLSLSLFPSLEIPSSPSLLRHPLPRLIAPAAHCLIYNAREVASNSHEITYPVTLSRA